MQRALSHRYTPLCPSNASFYALAPLLPRYPNTRRYPPRATSNIFPSVNSANNNGQFFRLLGDTIASNSLSADDPGETGDADSFRAMRYGVADFGGTKPRDGIDARVAQIPRAFLEEQGSISRLACLLSPLQDEPPSPRAPYPPFPTYSTIRYDLYPLYRYTLPLARLLPTLPPLQSFLSPPLSTPLDPSSSSFSSSSSSSSVRPLNPFSRK